MYYDIKSMARDELEALILSWEEPRFRAGQVRKWVALGAGSFDDMLNLPPALRERLKAECSYYTPTVLRHQTSGDGTQKLLWQLDDGNAVETVLMRYSHGNTVCISTQVGCRMGCVFCASATGLERNLTAGEMLDEVRETARVCEVTVHNVVLMGTGEPLDNLENVIRFLQLLREPDGIGIGMRHVSVSTCGPAGGIERLAEFDLQVTLSVSLHAPDDETRRMLMPVAKASTVRELIESCNAYRKRTGRRVSYEYLLADGVNDSDTQALLLAELLRGSDGHVNLIPLNEVEGSALKPSERTARFVELLEKNGVNVTVRRRMGADIDAACGQLRKRGNP